jgi:outer membrane protein TolC
MRKLRRNFLFIIAVASFLPLAAAAQEPTPPARLTLKSAVEQAVRNSRDLAYAKLQVTLTSRTVDLDRSVFRPNLFTGSGLQYSSGLPLAPGGGVPALFELSFSQSIYNPQARGQLRADEERSRAQTASLDSVRDAVMVRAALTYLELGMVRHSLKLLRGERENSQRITDLVRERVAAGFELPIEQTKAELNSARIEQRIAHNEGREDALEGDLRDMLGLVPDQPLELAVEDLPPTAEQPIAEIVAQAVASSPELKRAEAERRAREAILAGMRASRWPSVDLVGNYSVLSNTNNFTTFFKAFQRNNVNVGVQVTIPLLNSRTNAAISLAQADANAAEMDAKNKRSQVELRIRSQAHQVRELDLGRDVARLDLKLAQQNLGVVQAQFDQGHATLRELEQAHLEENDKWLAFLGADFQRQQSELALLQATGQVSRILQ